MNPGSGRSIIMPVLAVAVITAGCVSIPWEAPAGSHSGEGAISIEPAMVTASSDTRFRIALTVGPTGLVAGGGFRIELPVDPVHPFLGFTPPHTGKQHLRGHVECYVERNGTPEDTAVAWGAGREAGCQLKTGSLRPGDQLVMRYWGLAPRVAGLIPLHVETRYSGGGGGRMPAWPPVLTVNPRPARALFAVLPSAVETDKPMTLTIVALDEFGNRAVDYSETVEVRFATARFTHAFRPDERGVAVISGLAVTHPGFLRAEITEMEVPDTLPLETVSNPVHVTTEPAPLLLWGDLHFHTGTGASGRAFMKRPEMAGDHRGNYTKSEDAYAYARDVMRLDFAAATEHATALMSDEAWESTLHAAASALEPGRFTTFAAFQWRDRLVLLPSDRGRLVRSDDRLTDEPRELRAALERDLDSEPLIMRLASSEASPEVAIDQSEELEAVEIYSWRNRGAEYVDMPGRFEPGPSWARLDTTRPVSLIAGSDNHWGTPGGNDLTGLEPGNGGLTAVLTTGNDRAAILEALRDGRSWATTGARILLSVAVRQGHLEITAAGTKPFERIDLVLLERGGSRIIPVLEKPALDFEGTVDRPHADGPALFYLRAVQQDGERAWSSLIPVTEEP